MCTSVSACTFKLRAETEGKGLALVLSLRVNWGCDEVSPWGVVKAEGLIGW